jgi:hypothetical protein
MNIVDLTHEQVDPPKYKPPKHLIQKGRVVKRSVYEVDTIVVHQTAVVFGVLPRAVKEAGGDRNMAKHRRALQVASHLTAFDTGFAVVGCPLSWYVYNCNKLNSRSLGLEIEGVYPALLTAKSKELFTGLIEQASRDAIDYMVIEGKKLGMPIQYIAAHRQSSADRRGDPGEEIWKKLVLGYAVPRHGLIVKPTAVWGDGRPLPQEWDSKEPKTYLAKY